MRFACTPSSKCYVSCSDRWNMSTSRYILTLKQCCTSPVWHALYLWTFSCFHLLRVMWRKHSKARTPSAEKALFLPSILEVLHLTRTAHDSRIIFRNVIIFLDWFGVSKEADVHRLLMRYQKRKSGDIFRVLGGMRWDQDYPTEHIHISCGQGCSLTDMYNSEQEMNNTVTF